MSYDPNSKTIKREVKLLTTYVNGNAPYLVAVATDGSIWTMMLGLHSSRNGWLSLPSLPEASNPHYIPEPKESSGVVETKSNNANN